MIYLLAVLIPIRHLYSVITVIMNDTVIGEGAELKYVILDKNVTVTPGAKLIGTKKNPIIVKRGETV